MYLLIVGVWRLNYVYSLLNGGTTMTKIEELVAAKEQTGSEDLENEIKIKSAEVKVLSNSTLINTWLLGKLITGKQLQEIKNVPQFDKTAVKSIQVRKNIFEKETGEFKGYELVTRYFNKYAVRTDAAISAGFITDEEPLLNMNELSECNLSELSVKNKDIHQARSELWGLHAVQHARKAAKAKEMREQKELKAMSLKEIYQRAVDAKKLKSKDLTAHNNENEIQVEPIAAV